MERPLHLCEVLEHEHYALYGRDWRVTPADIRDANRVAAACVAYFRPDSLFPIASQKGIDVSSEKHHLADDLNKLIDYPDPLVKVRLEATAADDDDQAVAPAGDDQRETNRRKLDALCGDALRPADDFGWLYDREQIRNLAGFDTRWREILGPPPTGVATMASSPPPAARDAIVEALNAIVTSGLLIDRKADAAVGPRTRKLLDLARDEGDDLTTADLQYLNRVALDDIFCEYLQRGEDARLAKIYEVIHRQYDAKPTTALCISGGGIRSATFGLGLIQGLARRNLLDKFDYLSTVSGGGYIGGWLSSWIRRHRDGARGVAAELACSPSEKLSPDPPPVRHLREFSNYLTPRVGALSGDTLSLVAIYLRNLLLNWFIIIPVLVAGLALPRLVNAIYFRSVRDDVSVALFQWSGGLTTGTLELLNWMTNLPAKWPAKGGTALWQLVRLPLIEGASVFAYIASGVCSMLSQITLKAGEAVANRSFDPLWITTRTSHWIAGVALLMTSVYLGRSRPNGESSPLTSTEAHKRYFRHCLLPMLVAAVAMTAAWVHHSMTGFMVSFFVLVPLVAGFVYWIRYNFARGKGVRGGFFAMARQIRDAKGSLFSRIWISRKKDVVEGLATLFAGGLGLAAIALLCRYLFKIPIPPPTLDTFPSPVLSMVEDLPFAPLYVCFAVPLVLSVLFFSGSAFVGVSSSVNEDYDREWWARSSGYLVGAIVAWVGITGTVIFGPIVIGFAPKIITAIGGVSGIVSLAIGRSAKTPAKGNEESLKTKITTAIAAPLFILFVLASLSLLTSKAYAPPEIVTAREAKLLGKTEWSSTQKVILGSNGKVKMRMGSGLEWHDPSVAPGSTEISTAAPKRVLFDAQRFTGWNHLQAFYKTQFVPTAVLILFAILTALLASMCVNVNKFSMHSMYRNRLIRAYLGASRGTRSPNPLTGFDPGDNVAMHMMRPELLWPTSFIDFHGFLEELRSPAPPDFTAGLKELILRHQSNLLDGKKTEREIAAELFQVLNLVLEIDDLSALAAPKARPSFLLRYKARFSRAVQSLSAKFASSSKPRTTPLADAEEREPRKQPEKPFAGIEAIRRNREILDAAFSTYIYPYNAPVLKRADVRSMDKLVKHFAKVSRTPIRQKAEGKETVGDVKQDSAFNVKITIRKPGPGGGTLAERLVQVMSPEAQKAIAHCHSGNARAWETLDAVLTDLNRILNEYELPDLTRVKNDYPIDYDRVREHRNVLDSEFADALYPLSSPRPMHVVNVALNLVSGENLAWQERKAESFTMSPMHCGSFRLGYRDSSRYAGDSGISLGTAMTISGAAVSPNMGYHSSPALAFLMTLFNVRLGWWLGNPGPHGASSWRKEGPQPALASLKAEATGDTNDCFSYVYLSDGGHFENLGLYEMVLRRRHYIIVSDAGCDPQFAFDDLGNAIRKIRMDLGVPIDIDKMCLYPRDHQEKDDEAGKYCALGTIRYSAVDRGARDGHLLYIKPAVYMSEPKDVFNYAESNPAFPHETTGDQWFSESQFESYRMLGSYIIDQICLGNHSAPCSDEARATHANWTPEGIEAFFTRAADYLATAKERRRKYRPPGARV
jgi:hypothetical protein